MTPILALTGVDVLTHASEYENPGHRAKRWQDRTAMLLEYGCAGTMRGAPRLP